MALDRQPHLTAVRLRDVGDIVKRRLPASVAALSLAIATPGLANPANATFTSAAVDFAVPIPAGYCPASGDVAHWAAERSAKDTRNETKVTLVRCDAGADPKANLIVVTVTRRPPPAGMTRAKMLALAADMLKRPGIRAKLNQDDPREPRVGDVDDFCVYVAFDLASNDAGVPARGAGCMTIIGGQGLTVFERGYGMLDKDLAQLKREVRTISESIKAVPHGS